MLKNNKKVTMLFFVAATMLSFASCNKDNNNDNNVDPFGGHDYVDLGLSVKWATCNIGATSPENYGNFYAFGETITKNEYSFETYMCTYGQCGSQEDPLFAAGIEEINGTKFDVAHVNWGHGWTTPTSNQMNELVDSCTWTWTIFKNVQGYEVKGPNGNSIFLPCAGYYRSNDGHVDQERSGVYWTSTVIAHFPDRPYYDYVYARFLSFYNETNYENYHQVNGLGRSCGLTIRPVHQ